MSMPKPGRIIEIPKPLPEERYTIKQAERAPIFIPTMVFVVLALGLNKLIVWIL